ncbi:MAG: PrsW family intramembrane metalloprotease [bacterium]|nr:PrsW family intramembrane metalloprotease [bacterium]MCP5067518.1 PrsW family intramembrane metalloprotease [bacterium]
MPGLAHLLLLIVPATFGGAAAWIAYLRWKDRRTPEPWPLMIAAAALGSLAVLFAHFGYRALDGVGLHASWELLTGPLPGAMAGALAIGTVEETAKLLPVLPFVWAARSFNEIWDGPVYAGASAVGFALAEAVLLASLGETDMTSTLARAAAAPITHVVFAGPWGLGLAYSALRGARWAFPLGFAISATSHGAYDLLLARPGLQLAAAGLVGVLWLVWIAVAARLTRERRRYPRPDSHR